MEIKIERTIKVKLGLTEIEAKWLRAQMSAPINITSEMEEPRDKEMREMFFNTLNRGEI